MYSYTSMYVCVLMYQDTVIMSLSTYSTYHLTQILFHQYIIHLFMNFLNSIFDLEQCCNLF